MTFSKELIIALGIIAITFVIAISARWLLGRILKSDSAKASKNHTNLKFLKHTLVAIIYMVGFGIAASNISQIRALGSSLLAGAGMLTVVLGFASQQALSNVVAGVFIIIFKPFKVDDRIRVKTEFSGVVEDITLRHTVIRNFEGQRVIIPNSVMSTEAIVNSDFLDDKMGKWVEFHISFESDIDLAKSIVREVIDKHPLSVETRSAEQIANGIPKINVKVVQITAYSMLVRGWAWAKDSTSAFNLYCDVIEEIKKRFDAEGIIIPYPHHQVTLSNNSGEGVHDLPTKKS